MRDRVKVLAVASVDVVKALAVKVVKAAAVSAGIAACTVVANDLPVVGDHFGLPALATSQIVFLVLLARDFLKSQVETN